MSKQTGTDPAIDPVTAGEPTGIETGEIGTETKPETGAETKGEKRGEAEAETKPETEAETLKESRNDVITSTKLTPDQTTKLNQLIDSLPEILAKVDHPEYDEIFGHRINTSDKPHVNPAVRNEILFKFLVANDYDVSATKAKLVSTLNWRHQFQPLRAAYLEQHDAELDRLGAITTFAAATKPNLSVVTWNLYGNLKSPKKIFEKFGAGSDNDNNDKLTGSPFLRWRIGLMERSLSLIDYTSPTNHKIAQVHDYNQVSMFRIDPGMKQATSEIIEIFSHNYPELLSTKFFVNVPTLMSWVFAFFSKIKIISNETLQKFQVLNNGDLSAWFPKKELPPEYSGKPASPKQGDALFTLQRQIERKLVVPAYGQTLLEQLAITDNLSVE